MDAVELLSIIDIIKNEDLYNKKLQELREQQAKLADSRYMNLTIAKADQVRKEVEKQLEEAKKVVEKAKQDAAEQDKQFAERLVSVEKQRQNKDAEADKRVQAMKDKMRVVNELEVQLKEWDVKLSAWDQRLTEREKHLTRGERNLNYRVEKINQVMKEEANG